MAGENRAEDGSEAGAGTKGDALAKRNAKVAHAEAEGKAAHAPEDAEEDGEQAGLNVACEKAEEGLAGRHGQKRAQQREDQPGEDALYYPVTLPAPGLYLIDRNVAAALAEGAYCDY